MILRTSLIFIVSLFAFNDFAHSQPGLVGGLGKGEKNDETNREGESETGIGTAETETENRPASEEFVDPKKRKDKTSPVPQNKPARKPGDPINEIPGPKLEKDRTDSSDWHIQEIDGKIEDVDLEIEELKNGKSLHPDIEEENLEAARKLTNESLDYYEDARKQLDDLLGTRAKAGQELSDLQDRFQELQRYKKKLEELTKEWKEQEEIWKSQIERDEDEGKTGTEEMRRSEIDSERLKRIFGILRELSIIQRQIFLTELKWNRESILGPFEYHIVNESIKFEFVSGENFPELEKLPRSGGSLREGVKDVKDLFSQTQSNRAPLATMVLYVNADILSTESRIEVPYTFSDEILILAKEVDPTIPNGMRKKPQLRAEAASLESSFPFRFRLTTDHRNTLRDQGVLVIDLKTIEPVERLKEWILVSSEAAKIELIKGPRRVPDTKSEKPDETKPAGTTPDKPAGTTPDKPDETTPDKPAGTKPDKPDETNADKPDGTKPDKPDEKPGKMKPGDERGKGSTPDRKKSDEEIISPNADPSKRPNPPIVKNDPTNEQSNKNIEGALDGNWLTAEGVTNFSTEYVGGLWRNTITGQAEWFDVDGDTLTIRPPDNPNSSSVKVTRTKSGRYYGEAYTVPRTARCKRFGKWQPGALIIMGGSATGNWQGFQHDPKTCELTKEPDGGPLAYLRQQLTMFAPLAHGKFLHIVGSPTVGKQHAQFKATAKITFKTAGTLVAKSEVRFEDQLLVSSDGGITFDFITTRPGRHELSAKLFASDGRVIHREDIRIDIPGISGITK